MHIACCRLTGNISGAIAPENESLDKIHFGERADHFVSRRRKSVVFNVNQACDLVCSRSAT
jgi:hypothetical protein